MPSPFTSRIVVADVDAADRLAVELVRNVLLAYPNANVLAAGVEKWPKLRNFLADNARKFGFQTDFSLGYWDLCIFGDKQNSVVHGTVRASIALPDAQGTTMAERHTQLDLGTAVGEVVVVPGTARNVNDSHVATAETFGRLRRAERIAARRPVRVVILSGWNGRAQHSRSEAAQMLEAWNGPRVPIILDEAARTTAENALWSASFSTAMGNVRRVIMVTAWVGAPRLGLATRAAFGKSKIKLRLSVVWGRMQAASWRPALVGLLYLRKHLRAGRAFLSSGPGDVDIDL